MKGWQCLLLAIVTLLGSAVTTATASGHHTRWWKASWYSPVGIRSRLWWGARHIRVRRRSGRFSFGWRTNRARYVRGLLPDYGITLKHRERIRLRDLRDINTLVIHHSAGASGNVSVFRVEHIARGWADIGYHEVICNGHGGGDGVIEPGRPHNQVGAAVYGNNTGKLHVCLVGNFQHDDPGYTGKPTKAQMYSLGRWLLVNGRRYCHPHHHYPVVSDHRSCAIEGHATLCPGSDFPTHLIRLWYDQNIGKFALDAHNMPNLADFLQRQGYWPEE